MSFSHLYHLTFRDRSVRVSGLHIAKQLSHTLEAKWSSQTFKMPVSAWFGRKYNCKTSSYIDITRVLLHTRPYLAFSLNYFSFFIQGSNKGENITLF